MVLVDVRRYGDDHRPNVPAQSDTLPGDTYVYSLIPAWLFLDVCGSLGKSMSPMFHADIYKHLLYDCVKGLYAPDGACTQGKP